MTQKLKIKQQPSTGCKFWHNWKLVEDTGVFKYEECHCGARQVKQYNTYSRLMPNADWVLGKVDKIYD